MTAGQVSDNTGAAALLDDMPKVQQLLGNRGHKAGSFRNAPEANGIQPCIPGRRSRNEPVRYDKRRYRRRSRIEILFGRLKDWRRVAARYDRCQPLSSPPPHSQPSSSSGCDQPALSLAETPLSHMLLPRLREPRNDRRILTSSRIRKQKPSIPTLELDPVGRSFGEHVITCVGSGSLACSLQSSIPGAWESSIRNKLVL